MQLEAKLQNFASKVLLLGAAVTLVALLYAVWNRWSGIVDVASGRDALIYYVLPLLVIAAGLALAALYPGIDRFFALLVAISVVVALVGADIYLDYMGRDSVGLAKVAARRLNMTFDARSQAEVVADLRKTGARAFPFVRVANDRDLITLGVMPNSFVVSCNEFGPWFTPQTDRYGFVNPNAVWDDQRPLDIIIVGDSYAMGECDPTTGGFATILRNGGQRVLNLGIGGNDPLLDLASLVEFGSTRKAHFVFWMHYAGNDLSGLLQHREYSILKRYVEDPAYRQNLMHRMPEIENRLQALEQQAYRKTTQRSFLPYLLSNDGLPRSLRLYRLRSIFGMARNTEADTDFDLFARVLARARDTVTAMDAKLYIVNIPAVGQFGRDSAFERRTETLVKNAGLDFIDLKPIFLKTGDYATLYSHGIYGGHLSPVGNRVVAQVLSGIVTAVPK